MHECALNKFVAVGQSFYVIIDVFISKRSQLNKSDLLRKIKEWPNCLHLQYYYQKTCCVNLKLKIKNKSKKLLKIE